MTTAASKKEAQNRMRSKAKVSDLCFTRNQEVYRKSCIMPQRS